jgi:hypothetical protein
MASKRQRRRGHELAVNFARTNEATMHHPTAVTFLVVHCDACERDVLTARDLGDDGRIVDVCMHCDRHLDRDDTSAQWLDAKQLDQHGYFVDGSESLDDRHGGGGCRDGQCGVQQPQ